MKKVKAWAITSKRGVLIGGGMWDTGYTPLMVFSTRQGTQEHLNPCRTDKVVKCEIILEQGKGKRK